MWCRAGADTVVIQELTSRDGDIVEVQRPAAKAAMCAARGSISRAGEPLLAAGHRLTARDLQLAAGMNHPLVPVHRRPKVALFATGDELVPPGTEPGPGQIVYSNGFALAALLREEGAALIDLGVVGDKLDDTIATVRRARESGADILVTTGGASVGEYDMVQKAFAAEGMALSFWKVAMRPGRPLMHGRLGAMHVLGVPGNPVSSYVCAFLFLVPLIRRLAGRNDLVRSDRNRAARLRPAANDERADYMRATWRPARMVCSDAVPDPRQFPDGATRQGGLPAHSRAERARSEFRFILRSLNRALSSPCSGLSYFSLEIKWLRNTYRTDSVRS